MSIFDWNRVLGHHRGKNSAYRQNAYFHQIVVNTDSYSYEIETMSKFSLIYFSAHFCLQKVITHDLFPVCFLMPTHCQKSFHLCEPTFHFGHNLQLFFFEICRVDISASAVKINSASPIWSHRFWVFKFSNFVTRVSLHSWWMFVNLANSSLFLYHLWPIIG